MANDRTVPGIGPGRWDSGKLAADQEAHARRNPPAFRGTSAGLPYLTGIAPSAVSAVYRIYTETRDNLVQLVSRYFEGATLYSAVGLWEGQTEPSTTVEIIGVPSDRTRVLQLARAILQVNAQSSVLVTTLDSREGYSVYSVTAESGK